MNSLIMIIIHYAKNEILSHSWNFKGARFDDGQGGDNEVQRTMLELINQLDGFDPRGNIKVLMATNRPDTLDPALVRPGRLDRKVEFNLPDLEVRPISLYTSNTKYNDIWPFNYRDAPTFLKYIANKWVATVTFVMNYWLDFVPTVLVINLAFL